MLTLGPVIKPGLRPARAFRVNRQSWQAQGLAMWVPVQQGEYNRLRDMVTGQVFDLNLNGGAPEVRGADVGGFGIYQSAGIRPTSYWSTSSVFNAGTTSQTIAAWMPSHSVTFAVTGPLIKVGDTSTGFGIGLGDNTDMDTFGSNVMALYENVRWIPTGVTINRSQDNLIAMSIDASGFPKIYLNGVLIYSDTIGAPNQASSSTGLMGYGMNSRQLWGMGCEFRIWNRELSATEHARLFSPDERWALYSPPSRRSAFIIQPQPVIGHAPAIRTSSKTVRRPRVARLNRQSPQAIGLVDWVPGEYTGRSYRGLVASVSGVWDTFACPTPDGIFPRANQAGGNVAQIKYSSLPTLRNTDAISLSMWVFMTQSINSGGAGRGICSLANDDGDWSLSINCRENFGFDNVYGSVVTTSGGPTQFDTTHSSGTVFAAFVPHLLTLTWQPGTGLTMYCDAQVQGTNGTTTTTLRAVNGFIIGDTTGSGNSFPGTIYDFRVYQRALSQQDIQRMYDPSTRWDLYAPEQRRAYAFLGTETVKPGRIVVDGKTTRLPLTDNFQGSGILL